MRAPEDEKSLELVQKAAEIAMTAHEVKVICRLDAGNAMKVGIYNYDKVKVTTISGHTVNIDNIGIFDPLIYSMSDRYFSLVHAYHAISIHQSYSSGANARFFKYKSTDEVFQNQAYPGIEIDPKRILTVDGKPIDAAQYTRDKRLEFVQGEKITDETYAMDLYDYDFITRTRGKKVGTLPNKFIAIDQTDSKAKLFTLSKLGQIKPLDINLGGYLTLKYKEGKVIGYFSDENGTKDAVLGDEFEIDMNVLDFLSSVQDEDLKRLAQDEFASQQAIEDAKIKAGEALENTIQLRSNFDREINSVVGRTNRTKDTLRNSKILLKRRRKRQ